MGAPQILHFIFPPNIFFGAWRANALPFMAIGLAYLALFHQQPLQFLKFPIGLGYVHPSQP